MKRLADPYRDLDVIDSRAPRFNQATIGVVSALAVATGWWWLLGILAAQLVVGLTLGRRFCLACVAYFELVQPRFGEGPLEDARPPRFANLVGAVFLSGATAAYAAGLPTVGAILGSLVATLALLAAALIELGETDRARKLLAESLALSREIGEPHAVAVCLDTFAGLAAVVRDAERAATLFGASDAVRSSIGALRQPDDQILYDGWLARALAQLDTAMYSARYDEGHQLTLDEACAYALAGSEVLAS